MDTRVEEDVERSSRRRRHKHRRHGADHHRDEERRSSRRHRESDGRHHGSGSARHSTSRSERHRHERHSRGHHGEREREHRHHRSGLDSSRSRLDKLPAASGRGSSRRHDTHRSGRHHSHRSSGGGGVDPAVDVAAEKAARMNKKLDSVSHFISTQVLQRTKKDSDIQRRVFQLFGRPAGGLTKPIFKQYLHMSFGVKLTDEEADALFARYDEDGGGTVSIKEFTMQVVPRDYTTKQWAVQRADNIRDKEIARVRSGPTKSYLEELPKSMKAHRKSMWSTERLVKALQTKIQERVRRPEDQYRLAYHLFRNPRDGIKPDDFKRELLDLGLVVDDEDVAGLMDRFDEDNSGTIDFNEFVTAIVGPDFTGTPWYEKRAQDMRANETADWSEPVLAEYPASLKIAKPHVRELLDLIATKLLAKTKRPEDQYREAYKLFGSPKDGIRLPEFKVHMKKMGLVLSDKDAEELFYTIDDNASGHIDFRELIENVMPKDYTGVAWSVKRQHECAKYLREEGIHMASRTLTKIPKHYEMAAPTVDQIQEQLAERLMNRVRRPEDQYREAYRMFGCPRAGVDIQRLSDKVRDFGIVATPKQIEELFSRFDLNENGKIEFRELCSQILPKDWTRELWNAKTDDARRKLEKDTYAALVKESPFGLDKIPGWHGLKSFGDEASTLPPTGRSAVSSSTSALLATGRSGGGRMSTARSGLRRGMTLSKRPHGPPSSRHHGSSMPQLGVASARGRR